MDRLAQHRSKRSENKPYGHSRCSRTPFIHPNTGGNRQTQTAVHARGERGGLPENIVLNRLHGVQFAIHAKGKIERCFHTLQQGFESTLKLPDNRAQNLEELNAKLTHWIQTVYHLRPHGSTGISPQLRFAQAAGALRHLDAGLELEPFFFTRIERTVRKNGIVRIDDRLYEVDSGSTLPRSAVAL
jgi:hypothetical protein